jgi:hypothetical protein
VRLGADLSYVETIRDVRSVLNGNGTVNVSVDEQNGPMYLVSSLLVAFGSSVKHSLPGW